MKHYEKPTVITNEMSFEGVFLNSGHITPTVVKKDVINWGDHGQATFAISATLEGHVIVTLEYDQEITNSWTNDNGETTVKGATATYKFWNDGPFSATVYVECQNPDTITVKNAYIQEF